MKIIGQLWATDEKDRPGATTIQLKRRQKRVRVHKYCQLAEFGHRWQPGLIAYLATIGTYRAYFSLSRDPPPVIRNKLRNDRSVDCGQQLINGDWVTFTSELRVQSWRQSDWSNGDNMALTGAIQAASANSNSLLNSFTPSTFYLIHCDLSLFYKACGLHSKALPLLHAAWLAPLQGLLRWVSFCSCVCVIFQLIKLIKWANWRFGDLNYVGPLRGFMCAQSA